jgi:hypothetical protein
MPLQKHTAKSRGNRTSQYFHLCLAAQIGSIKILVHTYTLGKKRDYSPQAAKHMIKRNIQKQNPPRKKEVLVDDRHGRSKTQESTYRSSQVHARLTPINRSGSVRRNLDREFPSPPFSEDQGREGDGGEWRERANQEPLCRRFPA